MNLFQTPFVYNHKTMRRSYPAILLITLAVIATPARIPHSDQRLRNAFRRTPQDGWTYVHLEGTAAEIGYQHGSLLSKEIKDGFEVQKLELLHDSHKPWAFYRDAARTILWPHIPAEYREELRGVSDGLKAAGVALDLLGYCGA
jgi:hypothetical protein